jgi:hypothetical protein
VRAYHGKLQTLDLPPIRSLEKDMLLSAENLSYLSQG